MQKQKTAVVVPLYTTNLSKDETMSLQRSVAMLGHFPFIIICPEGLDLSPLYELFGPVNLSLERFDPDYFKGIKGYNRLMLSEEFYNRFIDWDYILICQADVFVFRDELQYWVDKGYDYIGGPWIATPRNRWNVMLFNIKNFFKKKKKSSQHFFKVGNGGFSLRRVSVMQHIVSEQKADIEYALAHPNHHKHHIEDIYFSLLAPQKMPEMKIPGYKEAVGFSFDRRPHLALKINGGKLPFACHAFNKTIVKRFWRPIIKKALKGKIS